MEKNTGRQIHTPRTDLPQYGFSFKGRQSTASYTAFGFQQTKLCAPLAGVNDCIRVSVSANICWIRVNKISKRKSSLLCSRWTVLLLYKLGVEAGTVEEFVVNSCNINDFGCSC